MVARTGIKRRGNTDLPADANNIPRQTFRNVRCDITSVRLINNGGTVSQWTSCRYDALGQILKVKDAKNNLTALAKVGAA